MTEQTEAASQETKTETSNPRLPLDLGFGHLGLLMQLVAGSTLCIILAFTFIPGGGLKGTGSLVLVFTIARSMAHFGAGWLLTARASIAPKAVLGYGAIALLQFLSIVLAADSVPGKVFFSILLVQMAWPVALICITQRPTARQYFANTRPNGRTQASDDQGVKGTGLLMLVLGILGTAIACTVLYLGLSAGGMGMHTKSVPIVIWLTLFAFVARAIVHAGVGSNCLGTPTPASLASGARIYFVLGLVSTVLLLWSIYKGPDPDNMFRIVLGVGGLFMLWPILILLRQTQMVPDSDEYDELEIPQPRDLGLTALGFLLLGISLIGLTSVLVIAILGGGVNSPIQRITGDTNQWRGIIVNAAMLWAGIELVIMSKRFRMAAYLYGTIGAVTAIINFLMNFSKLFDFRGGGPQGSLILMAVVLAMVLPLTTLIMARNVLPSEVEALWDD